MYIILLLLLIIKTLFKEETPFDKTTSIYHMFHNIETIIRNQINLLNSKVYSAETPGMAICTLGLLNKK